MQVWPRKQTHMRDLAILALILSTASCGGGGPSEPVTPPVAQITLTPLSPTVVAGQNVTLTAQPRDAAGNAVTGQPVAWSTSDASIATVSGGVVTAVKPGAATVTAASGTASANTTVTVIPAIAQVVVTPSPAEVVINETVQLTATLRDAAGAEIPARGITWSSSSDAAATVSATGQVTGKVVGAVTITATAEGKVGTTTVNVRPVPVATVTVTPNPLNLVLGQSAQTLIATTRDAGGTALGRPVAWTSDNESIATVTATGAVSPKAVGTATITATSEGKSGTATVVVRNAPVGSVTVTPSSSSIEAGTSTTLTPVVRDESGQPLSGRTVTWASSDPATATVSGSGEVSGLAVGTVTITATSEGKEGTATVEVVDTRMPDLLGLTLSPSEVTVRTTSAQVTISARLSDGSGITRFDVKVIPPNADPASTLVCSSTTPSAGTVRNGTFSCTITVPQGAEIGEWRLLVGALDAAGRTRIVTSTNLTDMGINPSMLTVK
jgi:uncharacterized protein YjdB